MTEHRQEVEVMLKAREAELQRSLTEQKELAEREELLLRETLNYSDDKNIVVKETSSYHMMLG